MMRRISSFLLMLILSISVMGCGNASAISESSNANTDISSTESNEPLSGSPLSVINTTETDNVSEETTTEVAEVASDSEPEQDFTGSLYTLPVGAKGEEWTEEQLDEYLKGCKAYQDNLRTFDNGATELKFDEFMSGLGFKYASAYEEERYVDYVLYEKTVGSTKFVVQLTSMSDVNICADNGKESVVVFLSGNASHSLTEDHSFISTGYLTHGKLIRGERAVFVKGACTSLIQVAEGKMDFARLPFALEYGFAYAQDGSVGIQTAVDYATIAGKPGFIKEDVYPE